MDDQVLRAMRKWPDVPAVYGWLRLGRRGQWFLVDRGRPGFDAARDETGSPITSPPILDFLGRNYAADQEGAWYWQNGPQRVYVDLELAPLILRVLNEGSQQRLVTQTGFLIGRIDSAASDADGNLLLQTDFGPALLDDRDVGQLDLTAAEGGSLTLRLSRYPPPDGSEAGWPVRALPDAGVAALGRRYGFIPRPRPGSGA